MPAWTNRDAVAATTLPESIAILGGGSVGVEFAQVWQRFGCAVTLIESGERILSHEEPETSELIAGVLRAEGVVVRTGVQIEHVAGDDGGITLQTSGGEAVRAPAHACFGSICEPPGARRRERGARREREAHQR